MIKSPVLTKNGKARSVFHYLFVSGALVFLISSTSFGQIVATYTSMDSATPLGIAPGTPAGSYALGGFETINPFNGNLNFRLPLLKVGGRGSVGYTVTVPFDFRWTVRHQRHINDTFTEVPATNWWGGIYDPYGPGTLQGRQVNDGSCGAPGSPLVTVSLTRLTFTTPDGTEFELRDQQSQGKPLTSSCVAGGGASRGTVFVTSDGTAVTFISDTAIFDQVTKGSFKIYPSGYLMFPDGRRYRIDQGYVSSIRDRNGNLVTLNHGSTPFGPVTQITDSLNRTINITYGVNDPTYGLCDQITFPGFQGASRLIRVCYTNLGSALRPGYALKYIGGPSGLFPLLNGSSSTLWDPQVIRFIYLPDGRSYKFSYDSYQELARVDLPTGGAFEYDWGPALVNGDSTGIVYVQTNFGDISNAAPEIYRQVLVRRALPNGTTVEGQTTYSQVAAQGTATSNPVVDHRDSTGSVLLARESHFFYNNPIPSIAKDVFDYPAWKDSHEYQTDFYDTNGLTLLRRLANLWQQRAPVSWWTGTTDTAPPNDPRIIETDITLDGGQIAKQTFAYDQYNNKTDSYEYDYGSGVPGILLRHSATTYLASGYDTNLNIHLRSLPTQESIYDGSGVEQARTTYEYDNYTAGLTDRFAIGGHDPAFSTTYFSRGNVTAITKWLLPTAQFTTRLQYDIAGNVISTSDARGNTTQTDYSSAFQFAYPTITTSPVPDATGLRGSSSSLITTTNYDFSTGKVISSTDANGQTTSLVYNDKLDRLTNVTRPAGGTSAGAGGGSTNYTYDDTNHIIRTETDLNAVGDRQLKSESVYDGLGRTIETRQYESALAYIAVDTTYDALGRKKTVSNPFRSTTDPTYGLTTFGYDALSRVTSVTTSDGAVVTTAYRGNAATVCDQANKQRRSATDALGRLTSVDEMYECPSTAIYATTTYAYDAQDNLTGVQQGVQTRSFVYNSLKQLTSATNPESGAVSYAYDANGNLTSKTDARGITTSYAYDALNRVTSRSYSDLVTPAVSYIYDALSVANSKGRLTQVSSSVSTTNFTGYDALGRVTGSSQTTNGQMYTLGYGYNLAGGMTSETLPSGRVISTSYDAAGRVKAVSGQKTGEANKTYASLINYAPQGGISSMALGNGLAETTSFNNRLQPTSISLGALASFGYGYGTTNNNDNVLSQAITSPGFTVTQNYSYDVLNRLTSVNESGLWSQTYGYDQYGNRTTVTSPTYMPTYAPAPAISAANNRISDPSFAYDGSGNLTQAPPALGAAAQTFAYDAENKLVNFNSGAATYSYDGNGRRVKKVVGSTTTVFVYNAPGQLVAEYTTPAPTTAGGTSYLTADHLGSTRVVTDSTGAIKARHDYLPFGEEIPSSIGGRTTTMGYGLNDGINQKFTAKERDSESGLDNFGARYDSSNIGRFMSPDPLMASAQLENPQSWNRYSYALNNPLRFTDPEGLFASPAFNCSDTQNACLNDEQRRILNNSTVEINGKKLSGEALYNALGQLKNGEAIQNAFVNITDRLGSVSLGNGTTALSQVQSITADPATGKFAPDRIFANVSDTLTTSLQNSKDFTTVSAGLHGDFDAISFKDTGVTFGNIQFSFNQARTQADIDIDIGNIAARNPLGRVIGAIVHGEEVFQNKVFKTTTNQDIVRRLLINNPKVQTITPSTDPKFNRP